jgi:hypothetical protein
MRRPIRSLTDPPALKNSHFATAHNHKPKKEKGVHGSVVVWGGIVDDEHGLQIRRQTYAVRTRSRRQQPAGSIE